MALTVRHRRDFWSGLLFLGFGLGAVYLGQDYEMGSARRMGPAYFPVLLGGLLALLGCVALVRALLGEGVPIERFYLRNALLILGATLLFGVLIRGAGLAPASVVLVLGSAWASPRFAWRSAALLAAGLALFAVVLFIYLLGLPMAALGPWLRF